MRINADGVQMAVEACGEAARAMSLVASRLSALAPPSDDPAASEGQATPACECGHERGDHGPTMWGCAHCICPEYKGPSPATAPAPTENVRDPHWNVNNELRKAGATPEADGPVDWIGTLRHLAGHPDPISLHCTIPAATVELFAARLERVTRERDGWERRAKHLGGTVSRAWTALRGWWQYSKDERDGETLSEALEHAIAADKAHDEYALAEAKKWRDECATLRAQLAAARKEIDDTRIELGSPSESLTTPEGARVITLGLEAAHANIAELEQKLATATERATAAERDLALATGPVDDVTRQRLWEAIALAGIHIAVGGDNGITGVVDRVLAILGRRDA